MNRLVGAEGVGPRGIIGGVVPSRDKPLNAAGAREIRTLLLIDTAGASGSVALALAGSEPKVLASETLPGRSASERLLPVIRAMVERQGIGLGELDAVAVVHGPGSFTGVRIGLSAAKGLCEGLGLPIVAISRLAALAAKAKRGPVLALLDGGRGELYCGRYSDGLCVYERLVSRETVFELAAQDPAVTMIASEPSVAAALARVPVNLVPELSASDALPIAAQRAGERCFDDVAAIDANYVRRSDSELFVKTTARVTAPA